MIEKYGHIGDFPPEALGDGKDRALLFKDLATLRTNAPLFKNVDEIRWTGPREDFPIVAEKVGDPRLVERLAKIAVT